MAVHVPRPAPGEPRLGAAYNRRMLQTLPQMLAPAVMERVTLLVNHVLGAEAVATDRLMPHAGKTLQLQLDDWPRLLPPVPPLAWQVTPAGLLEWLVDGPAVPTLTLRVAADNPALLVARVVGGQTPAVDLAGDAQLAGDVNWLMQNLRWDIAADLERVFPPVLAQALHRSGSALAGGVKAAVQGLDALKDRWRPR